MKKIFVLFILILAFLLIPKTPAKADDLDFGDSSNSVENAWYGQKQITDEEFEKTVKRLEDKKNNKKKGKKQGASLQVKPDDDAGSFPNIFPDDKILVSLPLELKTVQDVDIPIGHYNIIGKKKNGKITLEFWQADLLVASVDAIETTSDFNETEINFAKIMAYNEKYIKLIYGSMDFNAYSLIPIKNELSF